MLIEAIAALTSRSTYRRYLPPLAHVLCDSPSIKERVLFWSVREGTSTDNGQSY
jgi:hypothetical protein